MITNFKIFEKLNLDLEKLESDLQAFRIEKEEEYDWNDNKSCFKGTCQDITEDLEKYLKNLGYNAIRTRGYYSNANEDYYPNTENWDFDDINRFHRLLKRNYDEINGLKFCHWWIEIDNYIIDLTEDQFHPNEEDEYRIGIYKKPVKYYKKG